MRKKVGILLIMILLIISTITFAVENKTELKIMQKSSETKYLENDQGYISKSIVDSNADLGEVTIELNISNTKKEINTNGTTEIFFVIDNSPSMEYVTESGEIRKNLIINNAKTLASSIFDQSSNVRIGIVKFSGNSFFTSASINNATLVQELSNDKDIVLSGIQNVADSSTSSGTNIDAGLQKANNNFSSDSKNRIIVLFTDGVPTCDVQGTKANNDTTTEESLTVQANTKATIQNLSNSGVYLISMMTGLDPEDDEYNNDLLAINNIFGTVNNPTAGKFYNISDADIEEIVNNNILVDVIEKIQNPINTVKVVDYFPKDITENFEFSYVGEQSIGETSELIDIENNTITWDIGTLKGDAVATLKYKLKLKDMNNEELLNKVISTNEKVVLSYTDIENKSYEVVLDSSPKIKLEEIKEVTNIEQEEESNTNNKIVNEVNKEDNTVADKKLPNTGKVLLCWMTGIVTISAVVAHIRYKKLYM